MLKSLVIWFRRTFHGEAGARAWQILQSRPQPERVVVFVSYVRPGGPRHVCCLEQVGSGGTVTVERSGPGGGSSIERKGWSVTRAAAEAFWQRLEALGWSSLHDFSGGLRDGNHYQVAVGTGRQLKSLRILNPRVDMPHAALVETLDAFFRTLSVEQSKEV